MKPDNYKINLNSEPLSSEDIAKHMDFDALLEQVQTTPEPPQQKPYIRWMGYAVGAIALAASLIGALFFFGLSSNEDALPNAEIYFASQPYVNPPLEEAQQKFASFKVDANEGGVYEYESGSRLVVPKAAFMDDRGNLISGEVEIKYREYHDFVDFFLAGIPMEYDSAGTQYHLESAGMIEVYAEQNGQRLSMNPDKSIDVELVSEINIAKDEGTPQYNIYVLDTTQRNWVYQGVDNIELLEAIDEARYDGSDEEISPEERLKNDLEALKTKELQELASIEATIPKPPKPLKPERANEDAITFEMDFGNIPQFSSSVEENLEQEQNAVNQSTAEIDELRAQWEGTIWQVKSAYEHLIDEAFAKQIWDEEKSQIKPINERDYELTLVSESQQLKLIVNPVLSKTDYDAAVAKFNERFATYESQMAEREQQLAADKAALAQRIEEERELLNEAFTERIAFYKSKGREDRATDAFVRQKIVNRFKVSSFGIWNCDRPIPPYIYMLKSEFVDNANNKIMGQPAYLVNKNQNTLVRFFTTKNTDVRFNNNFDNLMWTITKDNKLAVFEPHRFKSIGDNVGEYTFEMNLKEVDTSNEEAIRAALQFD